MVPTDMDHKFIMDTDVTVNQLCQYLDQFAPLALAEDWDNVGLLLGDSRRTVRRIMTCLTLSPDVAEEALRRQVDLVVTHHPILFRPVQQIVATHPQGRMLLELAAARVAVYSPHTGFDSAAAGVNQQLAVLFDLQEIQPIRPNIGDARVGGGRRGRLQTSITLGQFASRVRDVLQAPQLGFVGSPNAVVSHVGFACGAAAEFMYDAYRLGCDVLVTGEARFHACLEAKELGIGLILAGHYQTERPAIENLAEQIQSAFPGIETWASETESDPVNWV